MNYFYGIRGTIRHWLERIKYGVSYRDVWNLDCYLRQVTLKGLEEFRKTHSGYPSPLTEAKWNRILDRLIEGATLDIRLHNEFIFNPTPAEKRKLSRYRYDLNRYKGWLWD